jgi:M6 family metalloprotease-like protein
MRERSRPRGVRLRSLLIGLYSTAVLSLLPQAGQAGPADRSNPLPSDRTTAEPRPRSSLILRKSAVGLIGPTSSSRSSSSPAVSGSTAPATAPAGPRFPHLLIARGGASGGARPTGLDKRGAGPLASGAGNAGWDPAGPLPPSILPAAQRERARSLLQSGTNQEWLDAFRTNTAARADEPDTVRILLLRVDFREDTAEEKTTGNGRFALEADTTVGVSPIDPPPHDRRYFEAHMEALRRYYSVVSGGSLHLAWDVYPAENDSAYHLSDTFKYGPWIFSNSNPDVLQHAIDLVHDGLSAADADPAVDFSRYQSVLLFHAGADFQGDMNRDSPWDIPSFNLYVQEPFVVQDSTVAINLVMVVPETANQDGFLGAMNGVIAHEFGHQLGFADLYDVATGTPVVGAFSLMDSGENLYGSVADPAQPDQVLSVRGMLPASVDPWHKALFFPRGLELMTPENFLGGDDVQFTAELPAIEVTNRTLYVPLNLAEYLLLENRLWELNGDSLIVLKQDKATGVILGPAPADSNAAADDLGFREYDYLLPGQGAVMWHIDNASINAGLGTDYGGVNIFYNRPGVGLIEGDGIRDIGSASAEYTGGPYDPYYLGGYTCLGPGTVPSSATNDGTETGVTACVLDSIGPLMRLSVSMAQTPAWWPVQITGSPREEQTLVMDLDRDGVPEIAVAQDSSVTAWSQDGARVLQVNTGPVAGGLAGREDFRYPDGVTSAPLLAAVSDGVLWFPVVSGDAPSWPAQPVRAAADSFITTTPVVLDSLVLVGCADGRIRALAPDRARPLRWSVPVADDTIRVLGAGASLDAGQRGITVFWAARGGEMGAFTVASVDPISQVRWHKPGPSQGDPPWPVSTLAASLGPGGATRYFFGWADGTLAWYENDGTLVSGWPVFLGAAPAGSPILCDVDQDGVLETVVVDVRGRLHCYVRNGVEDLHWPRSIWSEDVTEPPEQTTGPRALDVNGDGHPEIVLYRSDGTLLALDGQGRSIADWPRSIGSVAVSGPDWIPSSAGLTPRFVLGNGYGTNDAGERVTALTVLRIAGAQDMGIGYFPVAGADVGRSRVYPSAWIPSQQQGPEAVLKETLRLYPNPLRGDQLTVHFLLGVRARVNLEAFDLSGRKVAELEADGEGGADGNHLLWNLGSLAPGLYQIRFRALADGYQEELFRRLAIVR